MNYTGREGQFISLDEAKAMVQRFKNSNPPGTILSYTLGGELINEILNQDNCKSITIYSGMTENGDLNVVLIGVDSNGNELTQKVLDRAITCPPFCRDNTLINQ